MNHQDFVLIARDFLDAFTGRHIKRLRAGLGLYSAITSSLLPCQQLPDRIQEASYHRRMQMSEFWRSWWPPGGRQFSVS